MSDFLNITSIVQLLDLDYLKRQMSQDDQNLFYTHFQIIK